MRQYCVVILCLLSGTIQAQELHISPAIKMRFSGKLGMESWYFPRHSPTVGAPGSVNTFHGGLDLTWQFDAPLELRFNQRFQYDPDNNDRNRYEIEDLYVDWFTPSIELRAGYQVFSWKTVESVSQADFLNQTDLESDLLDPEKFSELALRARYVFNSEIEQVVELYYFARTRTTHLPVGRNRFSFGIPVKNDADSFTYQAGSGVWRPQVALSYMRSLWDNVDTRLFYFNGYNRFPGVTARFTPDLQFVQEYRPVHKSGLTFQGELNAWLVKGEFVHTAYQKDLVNQLGQRIRPRFFAYTLGFEYTIYSFLAANHDLGTILELIGDTDTGKDAAELESFRPFRNHLFAGLRYTFNNISDRGFLFGGFLDYREGDLLFQIEYEERLHEVWKVKVSYSDLIAGTEPLKQFGHTDRLIAELYYHF